MEAAGRLRDDIRRVRRRDRRGVFQRPPGQLAVTAGRSLRDLLSRRRARPAGGAWHLEKSDCEDRGRLAARSYRCEPTAARAIVSTRFCSMVNDAKNSRTIATPSAAPSVRVIQTPPQGYGDKGATAMPGLCLPVEIVTAVGDTAIRQPPHEGRCLTNPQLDYEFADCAHPAISAHRARHRVQFRSRDRRVR